MKHSNHLSQYHYRVKAFMLSILTFIFCTYNTTAGPVSAYTEVKTNADTLPAHELPNIEWGNVSRLVAENGVLTTTLPGGQQVIIKRKDYADFARKTQEEQDDYEKTFTKLEIEPEYPGGLQAWTAFIKKNVRYSDDAVKQDAAGTVVVLFIVEQDGRVTNVEAVSGPTSGGLRDEAVRLVKLSGSWHPGIQNFRIVRAYKKQAVTFWGHNTDW